MEVQEQRAFIHKLPRFFNRIGTPPTGKDCYRDIRTRTHTGFIPGLEGQTCRGVPKHLLSLLKKCLKSVNWSKVILLLILILEIRSAIHSLYWDNSPTGLRYHSPVMHSEDVHCKWCHDTYGKWRIRTEWINIPNACTWIREAWKSFLYLI